MPQYGPLEKLGKGPASEYVLVQTGEVLKPPLQNSIIRALTTRRTPYITRHTQPVLRSLES